MKKLLSTLGLAVTLALPLASQAQSYGLPGGQLLSGLPGTNAYVYTFVIGTTNATVSPVYLGNCHSISWEFSGACTNTTSAASIVFALFNDMQSATWYTTASNCYGTACRVFTIPMTTSMITYSTNYDIGAYQWMVPLYLTNASQCITNCGLRYGIKPGY